MALTPIIRQPDDLNRETWCFRYDERAHVLMLDSYTVETRATKRRKWAVVERFIRITSWERGQRITADNVPLPPDVLEGAMQNFVESLRWKIDEKFIQHSEVTP